MSWKTAKLGEVCTIEKGNIGIMKAIPGEYPLIVLGEERKTHNEYQFDDEAVIIPLVSSTGHGHRSMKRIFFQKGKFSVGSILCAVIPKDKTQLSAEFLYRYLDFNKENELVARMKGMANVSLPMKEIASVEIPLPPLEIQKEFITKFHKLEYGKNQISTELNHQLALVKELWQAYLREAMQGNLVAQDERDEPAEILLEKIKAEKEKLVTAKKIKRDKPLPPIKPEEIPFEIPSNWTWCRLGEIVQHNSGKTLDGGRNTGELREYITTSNLYWGYFTTDNLKTMPIEDEELNRCLAVKGDLLVCEGGEAGRAAVWESETSICFQNHIHRLRPYCNINSYYLFQFFQHINFSGEINNYRKGMGISNLSGKSLSSIITPLPPLAEQERIVAKLEKLMKFCDELEANIKQGIANADSLLQTALKEALEPKDNQSFVSGNK